MGSTSFGQNPLKRFKCTNCEAAYTRKDNFVKHLKYDCGNKAPAFPCPMCDYQARRKLQLQKHINTSHKSKHGIHLQLEDTFILLNCYLYSAISTSYTAASQLQPITFPFMCCNCGRAFSLLNSLEDHLNKCESSLCT